MKKLRRSEARVFAGLLGGLAEYFDIDPVLLRVAFIFFVLVTGFFPGVFAYLLAILVVPPKGSQTVHDIN